jgi:exoribonuclease R
VTLAQVRVRDPAAVLRDGLDRIRAELSLPSGFPPEVDRAAQAAASRVSLADRFDARDTPFISVDPPGSRDLDQIYFAERAKQGYRVLYAIADVAAFVTSGDAVDVEARTRGATLYLPDRRIALHPEVLSEGAASLLPGEDRPALLWSIELDGDGMPTNVHFERSVVRNREATNYEAVTAAVNGGKATESLALMREIGELRAAREADRNGVSVGAPTQEVVPTGTGDELRYDVSLPAERWNAQISLLAGMCAATLMSDAGVGIVRTLPPPEPRVVDRLRLAAKALGVPWPKGAGYDDVVRSLDPTSPVNSAFLTQAVQVLRGAGYELVEAGKETPIHSAVAAPYAHVTAPLRRLVDRFANEIVLAISADATPPQWAVDALPDLPKTMAEAGQRASAVEHAVIDLVESVVLSNRVGDTFDAMVIDLRDDHAEVLLSDPAVIANIDGRGRELGETVQVRLVASEPATRRVEFAAV